MMGKEEHLILSISKASNDNTATGSQKDNQET